jgi:hypothetical protein
MVLITEKGFFTSIWQIKVFNEGDRMAGRNAFTCTATTANKITF